MKTVAEELGWLAAKLETILLNAEAELASIKWYLSPQGIQLKLLIAGLRNVIAKIDELRKGFLKVKLDLEVVECS